MSYMFSNSLKTRLLSVLAMVFLAAGSFLLYIDYQRSQESVQAVIGIESSAAYIEQSINEHLFTNAITFLVTFLIAFFAVYSVIKKQIFNRLELLYKANKQLLSGDYSVAIKEVGNDEISHVIEGFNHMIQAISSREAKLVYSYQRTRTFFENSGEGIIIADKSGHIMDINKVACEIFGFEGKLPIGRSIHELVPEHYLQRHTEAFMKSVVSPYEPLTFNGRLTVEGKHQSGHIFPIELMVSKTLHDSEPIFIGIIKDLTDVVQAEKELENAKQKYFHQEKVAVVGQMAAGILHEIGNPIAAIDGSINYLKQINEAAGASESATYEQSAEEKKLRKENIEYLGIIAEQNHRLIELTKEISNYISPQQSQREIYNLNAILEHSRKLIRYDRRLKYINMLYNLDKNIPAIEGVQDHIAQVFLNFMINAGYAISEKNEAEKGLIIITSGIEKDTVYFSVADNGMGMSEEVQKKAIDAFYTTKEMGSGTGLGLSLCNSLVMDEGGRMEIISIEGLGTEIWVYLNIVNNK